MIKTWENISKSFAELWETVAEKLERLKDLFDSTDDYLEWKRKQEHMRASWVVPVDTRVKSQVVDNKPKFIVRKVIR